jgi:hypothetical protein
LARWLFKLCTGSCLYNNKKEQSYWKKTKYVKVLVVARRYREQYDYYIIFCESKDKKFPEMPRFTMKSLGNGLPEMGRNVNAGMMVKGFMPKPCQPIYFNQF